MDLGSPFALFSGCVMTICLLGTARCSNDSCPCPEVPRRHLTLPPTENCFKINQTFRYKCAGGNLRKAGTSNYMKCKQTDNDAPPYWDPSNVTLECIPDPSRTTTQPPESTATSKSDPSRTTTQPPESTATTASSSPQMTQSLSPSFSVSAEPDRPESTSSGLQAPSGRTQGRKEQGVRKTEATHRTTAPSTTAEPSDNGASDAHALPPAARTAIGCASVVIVCALIGISFYCYRRRSNSDIPQQRTEEQIPMNPSEH
ncbi:interleukin-15 receptor subunit alpha isoform X12 [Cebidichthys violaceus]|uniref:interleukin-15 receptor subunit alpha isoform X12 n=1 Tax=Cebidichthys violaceus TaxID=271503 RepID=UPI0035CA91CB